MSKMEYAVQVKHSDETEWSTLRPVLHEDDDGLERTKRGLNRLLYEKRHGMHDNAEFRLTGRIVEPWCELAFTPDLGYVPPECVDVIGKGRK